MALDVAVPQPTIISSRKAGGRGFTTEAWSLQLAVCSLRRSAMKVPAGAGACVGCSCFSVAGSRPMAIYIYSAGRTSKIMAAVVDGTDVPSAATA